MRRGVGSLEALGGSESHGLTIAAIDAKRGQIYLQAFEGGRALMAPDVLPVETACARLAELWRGGPLRLIGSGAMLLQPAAPSAVIVACEAPDPVAIARLALDRAAPTPPRPPTRPPDAKPSVVKRGPPCRRRRGQPGGPAARQRQPGRASPFRLRQPVERRGDIGQLLAAPGGFALMAEDGEPVGFILLRAIAGGGRGADLAVRPAERRQGTGQALLAAALALASRRPPRCSWRWAPTTARAGPV